MPVRLVSSGDTPPQKTGPHIDMSGLQVEATSRGLYISVPSNGGKEALDKIALLSARMRKCRFEHYTLMRKDPSDPSHVRECIDTIVLIQSLSLV